MRIVKYTTRWDRQQLEEINEIRGNEAAEESAAVARAGWGRAPSL
jgi:hypothetical protein